MKIAGKSTSHSSLGRGLTAIVGVAYTLSGVALLFAPQWFFETIAPFQPFNRHFLGDAGAFSLPVGIGLVVAAYRPSRYAALFYVGLWASLLHTANHLYDDLFVYTASLSHLLRDALPNVLASLSLLIAYWQFRGGRS